MRTDCVSWLRNVSLKSVGYESLWEIKTPRYLTLGDERNAQGVLKVDP